MNYGELKQAIADDTHRADLLTTQIPRFVRQCEGLIRRELRAYALRTTLTDSDRVSDGVFNFPARLVETRSIHVQGRQGDDLVRVSPAIIRRLDSSADVLQYCEYGDGTLEFRGVPGSAEVFDVLYYGTPVPFSADGDVNDLLTDHEGLYMAGSKFYLHLYEQDSIRASDELDIFNGIIGQLNEQFARKIGGQGVAPLYNFSSRSAR